ncbi:hypothetical protein T492DRAFT_1011591 [Pavlovales sp. CCMP2436]|nr:hypothetical protein T492DRAFT_1011591 [Pavlovales sp. CCMP2436]
MRSSCSAWRFSVPPPSAPPTTPSARSRARTRNARRRSAPSRNSSLPAARCTPSRTSAPVRPIEAAAGSSSAHPSSAYSPGTLAASTRAWAYRPCQNAPPPRPSRNSCYTGPTPAWAWASRRPPSSMPISRAWWASSRPTSCMARASSAASSGTRRPTWPSISRWASPYPGRGRRRLLECQTRPIIAFGLTPTKCRSHCSTLDFKPAKGAPLAPRGRGTGHLVRNLTAKGARVSELQCSNNVCERR